LIIDEELKLKRLKTIETSEYRTNIKNKTRNNKILEIQKYFAAGRLVNIYLVLFYFLSKYNNIVQVTFFKKVFKNLFL